MTETLKYTDMCSVCGLQSDFLKEGRSIRETYLCTHCRASLRYRAQTEVILNFTNSPAKCLADLVKTEEFKSLSIYEPGLIGPFRKYFNGLANYATSHFWENIPLGSEKDGVTCQNLESLTYSDNSFDLVISSDIFEHVRHPYKGYEEIKRVLKSGGAHIFSIPVTAPVREKTFYRVDTSTEEDIFLVEPHYHGAPNGGRSLVYTDFGSDMLTELNNMDFQTSAIALETPYRDINRLLTFISIKK